LEDVIEHCYKKLRESANQSQMVASGWIAIPEVMSLDEAHTARIFEAVGATNSRYPKTWRGNFAIKAYSRYRKTRATKSSSPYNPPYSLHSITEGDSCVKLPLWDVAMPLLRS